MTRVAELEAMVQVAWNRGTQAAFGPDPEFSREELRGLLTVYADELQLLGDPRGELITLDLLRTPTTEDQQRVEALVGNWLGGSLAKHPNVNTKFGLVGVSISDPEPHLLQEVLATPGGRYLSSVSIFGDAYTIRGALATLAQEVRPWLGALRVILPSSPQGSSFSMPVITQDLVARLVAATPALYTLGVGGAGLLRDFPHPNLRRMNVDGHETFGALVGIGAPLENVMELDFTLQLSNHRVDPTPNTVAQLLPVSHFPALRRLDLSRNEPGYQPLHNLGGTVAMYRFFRMLDVARQLTHVRLPALRSQEDRELLQARIDAMPDLVRLSVTQVYGPGDHGLRHPRAVLAIPPSKPWVPRDQLASAAITVPERGEEYVQLGDLVPIMERTYSTMPAAAREIWNAWWAEVVPFEATNAPFEFRASALRDALEACGVTDSVWHRLLVKLREVGDANAMIRVDRF